MCLVAFAINASARWPLVIAANRDEFFDRPTLPLGPWQTAAGQAIISGRDLRAGGTWLGMTAGGRVAFLTNVREANAQAAPRSRGELVTRWLEESADASAFARAVKKDCADYGGFNLVLGDFQSNTWMWLSNRFAAIPSAAAPGWHEQLLSPGVYGLSNAALNTPWPKTMALKRILTSGLTASENTPEPQTLQASLWTALGNRERAPREKLPATGVPLIFEEALSSAFVEFPEHSYGTRSSTVLLASAQDSREGARRWDMRVEERTHLHNGAEKKDQAGASIESGLSGVERYHFAWQQAKGL